MASSNRRLGALVQVLENRAKRQAQAVPSPESESRRLLEQEQLVQRTLAPIQALLEASAKQSASVMESIRALSQQPPHITHVHLPEKFDVPAPAITNQVAVPSVVNQIPEQAPLDLRPIAEAISQIRPAVQNRVDVQPVADAVVQLTELVERVEGFLEKIAEAMTRPVPPQESRRLVRTVRDIEYQEIDGVRRPVRVVDTEEWVEEGGEQ